MLDTNLFLIQAAYNNITRQEATLYIYVCLRVPRLTPASNMCMQSLRRDSIGLHFRTGLQCILHGSIRNHQQTPNSADQWPNYHKAGIRGMRGGQIGPDGWRHDTERND